MLSIYQSIIDTWLPVFIPLLILFLFFVILAIIKRNKK